MVKTHTFRLGKYHIHLCGKIYGTCDMPDTASWKKSKHLMQILDEDTLEALDSAVHEAMHAEGIPEQYLHDKEGFSDTMRLSKFLWRLGYRKRNK